MIFKIIWHKNYLSPHIILHNELSKPILEYEGQIFLLQLRKQQRWLLVALQYALWYSDMGKGSTSGELY